MKTKSILCVGLSIIFILAWDITLSQEAKVKKKLEALTIEGMKSVIVPNADVFIELMQGEKGSIKTNETGEFAISFSDIDKYAEQNSKVVKLRFTISPDQQFKYKYDSNIIDVSINKSDGPFYRFKLLIRPDSTNFPGGKFFIIQEHEMKTSGKGGAKQGKGSAVKTGDAYQGEVRHF